MLAMMLISFFVNRLHFAIGPLNLRLEEFENSSLNIFQRLLFPSFINLNPTRLTVRLSISSGLSPPHIPRKIDIVKHRHQPGNGKGVASHFRACAFPCPHIIIRLAKIPLATAFVLDHRPIFYHSKLLSTNLVYLIASR